MRNPVSSLAAVGLVTLLATGTRAQVTSVTYTGEIPLQKTNWSDSVSIPLFDPSLGELEQVCFTLKGTIVSDFHLESLDAAPATLTATASGNIILTRPDASQIVGVLPTLNVVEDVDAFDGVFNFGGTSGFTLEDAMATATDTFISPLPVSDLALFTGVGMIVLPVSVKATSGTTGAGNLASLIRTKADAKVTVEYKYRTSEVVPEMSSVVLLVVGGLPVAYFLRRRSVSK